jgi:hypothetical protein
MKFAWLISGFAAALAFAPAAHADWAKQDVPDFGFSGVFPAELKRESSTEDGVKLSTFAAVADGRMCLVVAGDYPYVIDPNVELVASRDNFVKGVKATLGNSKRLKVSRGATQLEAMEFDAKSATYSFKSLIVIEGSRAYQVAGGVPNDDADKAELETCLRGFALTAK